MSADLSWLTADPHRCPQCYLHGPRQGHRAHLADGTETGCENSGPLGLLLAREARDEGMSRTTAAHPDDAARVDAVIESRIRRGGEWSLNDLRHELTGIKQRAVIGARVQAFARSKRIVRTGYTPSTDPRTHGHPVALWRSP